MLIGTPKYGGHSGCLSTLWLKKKTLLLSSRFYPSKSWKKITYLSSFVPSLVVVFLTFSMKKSMISPCFNPIGKKSPPQSPQGSDSGLSAPGREWGPNDFLWPLGGPKIILDMLVPQMILVFPLIITKFWMSWMVFGVPFRKASFHGSWMGFCLMFCGLRNKEKRGSDLFDDGMKQKYHRPRKWQKYPLISTATWKKISYT